MQIYTTTPDENTTNKIQDELINKKLVSCVQVLGPIKSMYWWKNNIEKSDEWLLIIKSVRNNFKKIERIIKTLHPYEVPEIISININSGNKDYLNWIKYNSKG